MTATCETCRYACAFPDPGPAPVSVEPARHWLWGGEAAYERLIRLMPLHQWRDDKAAHYELVKCKRFPGKQPSMRKTGTCGEHHPITEREGA